MRRLSTVSLPVAVFFAGCSLIVPGPDSFEYRDASVGVDATPDSQVAPGDAGPDASTCTEGREECLDECVDLQTSVEHCGACGNACGDGLVCEMGSCVDPAVAVSASASTTCVRTGAGRAFCWGGNYDGQVGGSVDDEVVSTPTDVGLAEVVQIETGPVTCALTRDGGVWCWGRNDEGQLGDRALGPSRNAPVRVPGLPAIEQIAVGDDHACARTSDGAVHCWGKNDLGQLGDSTTEVRDGPVPVALESNDARSIASASSFTCAIRSTRFVQCWGGAPVGDGTMSSTSTPVSVGLVSVERLVADTGLSCGVSAGQPRCWGVAPSLLGADSMDPFVYSPIPIATLDLAPEDDFAASAFYSRFGEIQVGAHACVARSSGELQCWGSNWRGELGIGSASTDPSHSPQDVAIEPVSGVAVGALHTCAVSGAGAVYCWGSNQLGELAVGDIENHLSPVRVPGFPVTP